MQVSEACRVSHTETHGGAAETSVTDPEPDYYQIILSKISVLYQTGKDTEAFLQVNAILKKS